ncbi:hypothetical protein PISMIDRAFT_11368 [Pisolithus microcarpus 441]|uniref:DUF6532 domain-containing protein n=1 Tax=Pisolithus microcarpus 441 TaxID=765257 RepID=A0A0C9YDA9_9AGAM|nr:hypothetical protein PISMIDRAFT_11368 [Pisolithus microcarpus 441]
MTWRSTLKAKACEYVVWHYLLGGNRLAEENLANAQELIWGVKFVRDGVEDGTTRNMASPALAGLVIDFFYATLSALGNLFLEVFAREVPKPVVCLAATALRAAIDEYAIMGIRQDHQFESSTYSKVFMQLMAMQTKIDGNRKHAAMTRALRVNPKSYIGHAFKHLEKDEKKSRKSKKSRRHNYSSSSEDSPSSDDSSDNSHTSDDSGSDSSDESSLTQNSDNTSSTEMVQPPIPVVIPLEGVGDVTMEDDSTEGAIVEPILPVDYDGSDDVYAFQQFVTEGTAYVKDGNVPSKNCMFILSHHLTDKAREFYVRKVSGNPYKWQLSDFFTELFNYCFPIDFHLWQREKLQSCYQNSKTVKEYLYELNELWNMIGETDEGNKAYKFWFGL